MNVQAAMEVRRQASSAATSAWLDALGAKNTIAANGEVVTAGIEIGRSPADVSKLAAKATRIGINRLSPAQILGIVLVWLLLVGLPVIQQELPSEARAIVSGEIGTIALGVAITQIITKRDE
jgi:hypothetical protein